MSATTSGTCLLAGVLLAAATSAQVGRKTRVPDLPRVEPLIVDGTNAFRKQQGRDLLRSNPKLAQAARAYAQYLARTDKFSHTADGKEPWERTGAQGYRHCLLSENIAWEKNAAGFTTPGLARALVEGWKKSSHHRKNMLDPYVDEIGVGVSYSPKMGRYYAVQEFGRPKSEEVVFTLANEADAAVTYTLDGKDFTVQPRYTMTFQRCRPPLLTLRLPGETGKGRVFHPQRGSHYVIQSDAADHFTVAEK
jgi:uncharacterized protein YkwD